MNSKWLIVHAITICLCMSNVVAKPRKLGKSKNGVVKTIQTQHGIYDCVDFYKQPSLQDPRFRNHSFHPEMRPLARPTSVKTTDFSSKNTLSIDMLKFKGQTCPQGTVPIRKLNPDDERRQIEIRREAYAQLGRPRTEKWSAKNIYFAFGQSKNNVLRTYNGVGARMSIFNPYVRSYQYSSGEIVIKGGSDAIFTGWTVNPMVYKGDQQTRFFIYTVSEDQHCMGTTCGFIPVRSDIPLDFIFTNTSKFDVGEWKHLYDYFFFVYQDEANGNWWLQIGEDDTILGFWPQEFFHGLYQSGTYVACGGEVYGPPEQGFVAMGSGFQPKVIETQLSYCKNVNIVNEDNNVEIDTDLEPVRTDEHLYDVQVIDRSRHHYVWYGGPAT